MKILLLFFLLYRLSNNYLKLSYFFIQKIWSIIISIFYLLEYIFLFYFKKNYLYMFFIYKFLIIKNLYIFSKRGFYLNFRRQSNIKKKSKKKKENKYLKMFNKFYYHRRMYWGITSVYIHMFLRKIRESKNHIIFLINTRIIRGYVVFKWRIRFYSLFYFYWYNYRLFVYYKRLKKKIKKINKFINSIISYIKIKIRVKIKIFNKLDKENFFIMQKLC